MHEFQVSKLTILFFSPPPLLGSPQNNLTQIQRLNQSLSICEDGDRLEAGNGGHSVRKRMINLAINQTTDLPPPLPPRSPSYHANGRRRSKRSTTASTTSERNRREKKDKEHKSWSKSANHSVSSLPKPFLSQSSSSLLPTPSPSSSVLSSSMLSRSIPLASQMNPPYAVGSSSVSNGRHQHQALVGVQPQQQQAHTQPQSGTHLKNITAQVGHPVYMHCVVESVGDRMVNNYIQHSLLSHLIHYVLGFLDTLTGLSFTYDRKLDLHPG